MTTAHVLPWRRLTAGALYPAISPADAADVIVPHDSAGRMLGRAAHDGASPAADRLPGPVQPH